MNGSEDRLKAMIETSLLKKRYLLGIRREEYEAMHHRENGVEIRTVDGDELDSPEMRELLSTEYSWNDPLRWARHEAVDLLVAFDGDTPMGYYLVLAPRDEVVWHDELPVPPTYGLAFKGYVADEFRRMGVYRALQRASHDHLFYRRGVECVLTIVESRNVASLQANETFGLRRLQENYLLKFMGRNALSIYRSEDGLEAYWVWNKDRLRTL
jgi:RimJ/RimL family protein N-acetyltransferase